MGLLLTILFFGFPAYIFFTKGETWAGIACIAVIVVVWIGHIGAKMDTKAWFNHRRYWSMDGKDRYLARKQWREEAEREEKEAIQKAERRIQRKAGRNVEKILKRMQKENTKEPPASVRDVAACMQCGGRYREVSRTRYPSGAEYANCICQECGNRKLVKINERR